VWTFRLDSALVGALLVSMLGRGKPTTRQVHVGVCRFKRYILHTYIHYIHTLLCGTRSLMAMESRAIAGGLSADHQLPGVPKAKEVLLNKLIHNHSIDPPEIVTQ
jgi:hypothetical protein